MELTKRAEPIYSIMGDDHSFYPLVVRCLHDSYDQRPTAIELIDFMSQLKVLLLSQSLSSIINSSSTVIINTIVYI